mgnify:CR=1 FL=1
MIFEVLEFIVKSYRKIVLFNNLFKVLEAGSRTARSVEETWRSWFSVLFLSIYRVFFLTGPPLKSFFR